MTGSRTGPLFAAIAALSLLAGATLAPVSAVSAAPVAVVVQAADAEQAAAAVAGQGGTVDRALDYVGGVAARVSPAALDRLRQDGRLAVTLDSPLEFTAADLTADAADTIDQQVQALNPGSDWSDATGSGVGVALIDTGVADVPELAGRVIATENYSDEDHARDSHGHGTFMAGLIADVAPGAHIVSVKLAGRDGVTSLSKLLDAIGWVVVNQDEYGIRVLNLSLGAPTNRAPQADPLSAAVQAAWASGITVVAAAGNEGAGSLTTPGRDPWVITVGSTDANGTVDRADDTVPDWSGSGKVTSIAKPELLAPGTSTISLRAPGSLIDTQYPDARVGESHFRGSGTSMSAALVSGAVAALADLRPLATPDDFKGALIATGTSVAGTSARAVDLAVADAAEADLAWRQHHRVVFKGLDGRLKKSMPWSQPSSPAAEETWTRIAWADDAWTRIAWADADFARIAWARIAWADANFARIAWADDNFTRIAWARIAWARIAWAGDAWAGDRSWSNVDWTASVWDEQQGS